MDDRIVVQAQRGDHAAFTSLVNVVGQRLHGIAFNILRDQALAEEATPQGIVNIWRDLPKLRDPARFESWASRVVVNACYSEARRSKRWLPDLGADTGYEPRAPDELHAIHDRDELERALQSVSIDHRAILALRYYLDYPLEQIAETLDIPLGTAKSRLNRAIGSLRAALDAAARAHDAVVGGSPGEMTR